MPPGSARTPSGLPAGHLRCVCAKQDRVSWEVECMGGWAEEHWEESMPNLSLLQQLGKQAQAA